MEKPNLVSITSQRICKLRRQFGWSQAKLARALGVGATTVRQWENALSIPSAESVKSLCRVFLTTADYLLGMTDSEVICIGYLPPRDQALFLKIYEMLLKCPADGHDVTVSWAQEDDSEPLTHETV